MTASSFNGFYIQNPGMLTTLQDEGRCGGARYGLTQGGAADLLSYRLADALLGQKASCQLEIILGGLQMVAGEDIWLVLTGAEVPAWIDDEPITFWRCYQIKAGQQLRLGYGRVGLRSYLAISGGFRLPKVLGSNSTVVREQVGGIDGGALRAGQWLPVQSRKPAQLKALPRTAWPDFSADLRLRLVPGYQADWFSTEQWQQLLEQDYIISTAADRMGYRLQADEPLVSQSRALLSEGIVYGAVQLPPDGNPIVLLNDRQTLGGYPKPGAILNADAWALSQRKPGQKVRFERLATEQLATVRQQQLWQWQQLMLQIFTIG